MTTTYKQFAAVGTYTLYTCPANTTAIVMTCVVSENNNAAAVFQLYAVNSGAYRYIAVKCPLTAGQVVSMGRGVVLLPGDVLTYGNISGSVYVSGGIVEIS